MGCDTLTGSNCQPSGTFADQSMVGKIALIQRGACFFTTKVTNAQLAGAVAVVVYNHSPGLVNMAPALDGRVSGTDWNMDVDITIPSIFIDIDHGTALNEAVTAASSSDPLTGSLHCGSDSLHAPPMDAIACSVGVTLDAPGDFSKTGGYGNGHDCTWLLSCADGYSPSITFSSFQTEANWDFVRIYDGSDVGAASLANCHGSSCPDVVATGTTAFVRFTSDGSVTMAGFEASYTCAVTPDEGNPCGPRGSNNVAVPGNLDVNDGETFSYEQGATDYTNCLWTMQCPGNTLSTVAFSNLVTEGGWDFLNVFSDASLVTNSIGPAAHNGGVDNSGDLGRFSGSQNPGTVAGVAAVQYISDWSVQAAGAGFTATLTCEAPPDPCEAPVSVPPGSDFGTPSGAYPNNQDCNWVATCPAGRPVIDFSAFQTEGGWDFVTLYDGADNTASQLNRCHGSSCPTTVGTGTSVSVRLETDGSVTREGFTASFTCDTSVPYDPYDCTYTLVTEQKAMNAAERDCITRGGHLAAIHNPSTNAAIMALGADQAWIGFHDLHSEAGCTGQGNGVGETGGFIWTDGSPTDYLNWANSEPNDWGAGGANCGGADQAGEDCTHFNDNGEWNDNDCTVARNYVCQDCGVLPPPISYSVLGSNAGSWAVEAMCQDAGGHLASIHSDADRDAINALSPGEAWIGFHDTYTEAGCDAGTESGFVWTDGTVTDYTNWAGSEPNDWGAGGANCGGAVQAGEDCTHLNNIGQWNDNDCGQSRSAVCGFNPEWIPTACNGGTTMMGGGTFQKNGTANAQIVLLGVVIDLA
eukprot:COSAG04_NODE_577_length_12466_cov_81.128568_1_plen_807_part_10